VKYNEYGQAYTTEDELVEILYKNPTQDISKFSVETTDDSIKFNESNKIYHSIFESLQPYAPCSINDVPVEVFDNMQQENWHMPDAYKSLDIAQWLLDQCKTDPELQRVGQELLLYQERDLFNLLRYLKYFVDTMRENNIVWGLGRGSSVASYVLYIIGVHKINSMYYDLQIEEFLR
jgi:DNA polymerase III alpha subunit